MLITEHSILTGKLNTMELDVTPADYNRYKFGKEHVQNVFPHFGQLAVKHHILFYVSMASSCQGPFN